MAHKWASIPVQFEPDSDGWTTGSTDPFPSVKMDEECPSDGARIPVSGFAPLKIAVALAARERLSWKENEGASNPVTVNAGSGFEIAPD